MGRRRAGVGVYAREGLALAPPDSIRLGLGLDDLEGLTARDLWRLAKTLPNRLSISLLDSDTTARECWHWPLRFGVLPEPEGYALMRSLRQKSMFARGLADVSLLEIEGDAADVLLLPEPLDLADGLARLPLGAERVGAVVVLGGRGRDARRAIDQMARLRRRLGADIAVVAAVPPGLMATWANELTRSLSHLLPFDTAVWEAGRALRWPMRHDYLGDSPSMPLIVAGEATLVTPPLAASIRDLAARLEKLSPNVEIPLRRR
jgi:hypothetical protein